MQIIEQTSIAKNPKKKSEDGIVITNDFVAVIDGSTSKSQYRHSLLRSNGRQAMQLISRYLRHMPKDSTCEQFLRGVTAYVRKHYRKSMLQHLLEHPEDRLTASVCVFSRLQREIWLVGDCQCLVGGTYYDNPKPAEATLAAMRAEEARRQMAGGKTAGELLHNDTARPVIIPRMIETMRRQNIDYSVVDGFPIPRQHVRQITLCPTLAESEQRLMQQRADDPLNIGPGFQATKAFHPDYNSFDDRTYVRLQV